MSRRDKANENTSPLPGRFSGTKSGGNGASSENRTNGQRERLSSRMSWRDSAVITPQQIEDERIKQMELEARQNSTARGGRHPEHSPYRSPKVKPATNATILETSATRATTPIDGAGRMYPQHFRFKEDQAPSTTATGRQYNSDSTKLHDGVVPWQPQKLPSHQKPVVPAPAAASARRKEGADDDGVDSPYRPVRRWSSVRGAAPVPVSTRDIEEARIKQREYDERQRTMASSHAAGRKQERQSDNNETMPVPTAYAERMETYWATTFENINQNPDGVGASNRNLQRQYQEQRKNGKQAPQEQYLSRPESIVGAPNIKLPRRDQVEVADEREEQSAPKSPVIGAIACHRATTQMLTKGRLALHPTLSIRRVQPPNHCNNASESNGDGALQDEISISRGNNNTSDNSICVTSEQEDCQDTTTSGTMTAACHSGTLRYDSVEIENDSPNVNPPGDRPDSARHQTNKSRLRLFLGGFSIVLVVIVVMVTILFASNSNDNAGNGLEQDQNTFDYETVKPIQESLLSRLDPIIVDYSVFNDTSSPQSKALSWLAEKDETLQLLSSTESGTGGDGNNTSNSTTISINSRLATRYALAVLYYSTQGDTSWLDGSNDNDSFMSPFLHECDWKINITDADLKSRYGGVFCDELNRVTQLLLGKHFCKKILVCCAMQ